MLFQFLMQIWTTFANLIARYPAILDAVRLAIAGLFFESCRRGLDRLRGAIMRASTMTIYVDIQDELYGWLIQWAMTQANLEPQYHTDSSLSSLMSDNGDGDGIEDPRQSQLQGRRRGESNSGFLTDLAEEIYPTGRSTPRALELGVSSGSGLPYWLEGRRGGRKSPTGAGRSSTIIRPAKGRTFICRFQGHKVSITLSQKDSDNYTNGKGMELSIFFGTLPIYLNLVDHARHLSLSASQNTLNIFSASSAGSGRGAMMSGFGSGGVWGQASSRPLRPLDSVILPQATKSGLLLDVQEFLAERAFYEERGLPWRRGYLLYGVPGSGKSSLIAALGSKLGLGIYMIDLGARDMDDGRLLTLIQAVPTRSILVIEDVDCAFDNRKKQTPEDSRTDEVDNPTTASKFSRSAQGYASGQGRDMNGASLTSSPSDAIAGGSGRDRDRDRDRGGRDKEALDDLNRRGVTLSGLLNALDGLSSSEGRLLFCTTNYIERIDNALSRPGRCDVWLEFKNATTDQIRDLFLWFYRPSKDSVRESTSTSTTTSTSAAAVADDEGESNRDTVATEKQDPQFAEDAIPNTNPNLPQLAGRFAAAIPDGSTSAAAIQSYLMRFKRDPGGAVMGVDMWVRGGYRQDTREG